MINSSEYIARLREAMAQSHDTGFIEQCCAYAQKLLDIGLPVLFDRQHVRMVLNLNAVNLSGYHTFYIQSPMKSRAITAPSQKLKARQQWILHEILYRLPVSSYAHGFEPGHSIKTNAQLHADNSYALCLDIKDFFPSIATPRVTQVFTDVGYTESAADMLAQACCYGGCLPQGAPTSPRLANIIFGKADLQLARLADSRKSTYSRYADDLTFSSDSDIQSLIPAVDEILEENGFSLNSSKIHFYRPGQPKNITGLIVQNGAVRVPKRFKRALKQEIHYCQRFGVLTHLNNISAAKLINYREHLYGKAYFVHMIEPDAGKLFLDGLDRIEWPPFCH